jgi:hypothetical protein
VRSNALKIEVFNPFERVSQPLAERFNARRLAGRALSFTGKYQVIIGQILNTSTGYSTPDFRAKVQGP